MEKEETLNKEDQNLKDENSDLSKDKQAPDETGKKDEEKQIELLNEILKELNDIKFSKKIENLENKLIEKFDEKSYSDLIKLKSQLNSD